MVVNNVLLVELQVLLQGRGGDASAASGCFSAAAPTSQGPPFTPAQSYRQYYPFMFRATQAVLTMKEARAVIITMHQGSPFTQNIQTLLTEKAGEDVNGVYTSTGNS